MLFALAIKKNAPRKSTEGEEKSEEKERKSALEIHLIFDESQKFSVLLFFHED